MPPVSVPWLQLDSYETVEDYKMNSTVYLIQVDEQNEEPSPSSPFLIIIDDGKAVIEVLMGDGNWKMGDFIDNSLTSNKETSSDIERLKASFFDS